jgi:hypothetical protein
MKRLPLIFVAAVVVICLVAAGVAIAATGVSGSAVAYSVNGTKVSQNTVNDELDWLSGNRALAKSLQQQGTTLSSSDGSITSSVTASWLSQRIQVELLRQGAAKKGVTIPAASRKRLLQQAAKRYPHAPDSARETLVDGNAYLQALGLTTQAKQSAFFTAAVRRADVTVDPRYGRWNPNQGVCPPTGCSSSATAGG